MFNINTQRKTYLKYSREMRLELIRLVNQEKLPTAQAARRIGIKQTSACRIMRTFHKEHRIFQSKMDKSKRIRLEAIEHCPNFQKNQPLPQTDFNNQTQKPIKEPQNGNNQQIKSNWNSFPKNSMSENPQVCLPENQFYYFPQINEPQVLPETPFPFCYFYSVQGFQMPFFPHF